MRHNQGPVTVPIAVPAGQERRIASALAAMVAGWMLGSLFRAGPRTGDTAAPHKMVGARDYGQDWREFLHE